MRRTKLNVRPRPIALAVVAVLASLQVADAATRNWVGGAPGGVFWDLANWDTAPVAGDDVLLGAFNTTLRSGTYSLNSATGTGTLTLSAGTLRLAAASSLGSLALSGGVLSGPGSLALGTLAWTGGQMGEGVAGQTGGSTTVSGLVTISGANGKNLYYGRALNLNGGAQWSGSGSLNLMDATTVGGPVAASSINLAAGQTFDDQGGGGAAGTGRNISNGIFNNAGTYTKSAGADYTYISAVFNNTGTLNANSGNVRLAGGGTSSGAFNVAALSTLTFEGGVHNLTGGSLQNLGTLSFAGGTNTIGAGVAYSGGGAINVSGGATSSQIGSSISGGPLTLTGGTLRLAGDLSTPTLTMSGGTLSGTGTVTTGTLAWTGGTMGEYLNPGFGGATTVTGLATLSGANGKQVYYGRTLNLNGGAVWSGAGSINMTDATTIGNPSQPIPSSVINLAAGQTFDDQGSGSTGRNISNGIFNNAGTYTKSAGTDFTYISALFNNTGTLNANSGTVRLVGGGTSSGAFNIAAGATLTFEGGTHTITSGSIDRQGALSFGGGTNTIASGVVITGGGAINLSGGTTNIQVASTLSSTAVTTTSGTLQLAGGLTTGNLTMSGGTLRVAGALSTPTLTMSGGTLSGAGTATTGTLAWTGGTMGEYVNPGFGGTTTVTGQATISGSAGKQVYYGRTLNLNGGAVWSGAGSINMTDATTIFGSPVQSIPSSVINLAAGQTFDDQGSGAAAGSGRNISNGIFNNAGTYTKSAGADYTYISATFNNTGTLNANSGTVRLAGGGSSSGAFSIASGATLAFEAGTHTLTGGSLQNLGTLSFAGGTTTIAGSVAYSGGGAINVSGGTTSSQIGSTISGGPLSLTGGTLRLAGNLTTPTLTLSGGTLSGAGTVTAGTLAWTGGTMGEYLNPGFGGTTTVTGLATLSGSAGKQVYYGRTLNLNGGAVWSGGGSINMTDATTIGSPSQSIPSSVINLAAGQTFDDQGSGAAAGSGRNISNGTFNNAGTYTKSAGADYTYISALFNNTGTLNANSGTVRLAGGGTSSGAFNVAALSTLTFEGGVHNLTGGSLQNLGTLSFAGGTNTIGAGVAYSGGGAINVSGGTTSSQIGSSISGGPLTLTGGTLRLAGDLSTPTLTMSGGTLSGAGTVTAGTLAWTGGTMGEYVNPGFGGTTTVTGLATLSSANGKQLYYGRTLNLNGGAVWSGGGSINMTDATTIGNPSQPIPSSVINLAAGQLFDDQGSGAVAGSGRNINQGIFNNAGTYTKSAGVDWTYISAVFNNTGALNVNSGMVRLAGGGSSSGSITVAAGATLQTESSTFAVSGSLSNAGTLHLYSGTTTFTAPMSYSGTGTVNVAGGLLRVQGNGLDPVTLSMTGGTLSGAGTVTVGTLNWTSGTMGEYEASNFGGTTNVTGLATLSGNGGKQIYYGRTLNLNGGAVWSGGGSIGMTDATTIGNPSQAIASSIINLAAGQTFDDQGSGGPAGTGRNISQGIFNNAGTYTKSAGDNFTYISATFNNSGTLNANAGTVRLAGGGSSSGAVSIGSGATLQFESAAYEVSGTLSNAGTLQLQSGTVTFTAPMSYSGSGVVNLAGSTLRAQGNGFNPVALNLSGGTLSGGGAVTVGTLNWTAGTMGEYEASNFGGTTRVTGQATISGGSGHQLYYGRTLQIDGSATWTDSGAINMTGPTTIGNPAVSIPQSQLLVSAGATFNDLGSVSHTVTGRGLITIAGDYIKSGAGLTQVQADWMNSGTTRVTGGTLQLLNGNVTNTGIFEANGGTLDVRGGTFFTNLNLATSTLTGGTYNVFANSTFQATNANIVTNAATMLLDGANSNVLNASTLTSALANFATNATAGNFTIRNGRNLNTAGALANAGQFTVGTGSTLTVSTALNNTGTFTLDGGALSATTISNSGTLTGAGNVLVATVQNSGLVRATGGTLAATKGITGTSGDITINGGATLDLSGSTVGSTTRVLSDQGLLNLGAQNLTVYKDYDNTNFGSGNAFNARAGVSGTGQIVGNGASQTLTGNVTSTGANSWNLNLGNVRGGTVGQASFQVQNNGTGTDIRGAVQTGANGASITDTRLSGITAGNFGPIVAGGSSGNFTVTLAAGATGGNLSGQTLAVASNFSNVSTQTITLNGFSSVLAQGSITPSGSPTAVNLGNFRVGSTGANSAFAASNSTTGAGAERLGIDSVNASAGFLASNALGTALVNPGASQAGAITARASGTGTAGVNNGTVTVQFASDGTAFDAAWTRQAVNTQVVNVTATGYNAAVGNATPSPITLFNQRVGGAAGAVLSISNTAAAGSFSEDLNASFGGVTGSVTTNGAAVNGLLAGSSNSSSMVVGVDTGTAGAKTGTVTLSYQTTGAVNGVAIAGLSAAAANGPQVINVSGNVYQVAQSSLPGSLSLGNFRVGSAPTPLALSVANLLVAPAGFQEGLNVSVAGVNGGFTANGTITNLAAGANSNAISVGLNAGVVGSNQGVVTLNLASNGQGTSELGVLSQGTGTVNVSATGYNAAVGAAAPGSVNLGNFRVGLAGGAAPQSQNVALTNTVAGPFTESLGLGSATLSGTAFTLTNNLGGNLIAAGATNGTALSVARTGGVAGVNNGTLAIQFTSDGQGTSGLAAINANSQTVNVTATGYNMAQGSAGPNTISLGSFRVGLAGGVAPQSQNVTVSNTVGGPNTESLGLGSATLSGTAFTLTNNLGAGLIAAGASNGAALSVARTGGVAGVNNGTLAIQFTSDGQGTSGLGVINANGQNVAVTATGYNTAVGAASPTPINLGNFRVGVAGGAAPQSQNVAVSNTVGGSFTESLGIGSAALSGTAFSLTNNLGTGLVAAGGSNANALTVARTGGVAGVNNGTVAIQFTSDGTGTSGLGAINANSQNVAVQASGFVVAQGSVLPTTVNLGNFRAGTGAQTQTINVSNTATGPTGYVEGLAASIGSTTGTATGTGFGNAAAGSSGALVVGLSGIAAGNNSGTVNVQLQSNGTTSTGSNGLGSLNLGASQAITVTGTGWRLAQAGALPVTINLGNVLVGSSSLQALNISNTALSDGFSERLDASFKVGGTTGDAITNGGAVSLLAAGASSSAMSVGLNTSTIGAKSGQVIVAFNSNGLNTSGLGITALPDQSVGLTATIIANVGTLAQPSQISPNPVNFGNFRVGAAAPAAQSLTISNLAQVGEGLNASISTASNGFGASGSFNGLAPGATSSSALQVSFADTATAGAKSGTATVALVSDGTFNGGTATPLASQQVQLSANVFQVAQASLPASLNLGNFRVGTAAPAQAVVIGNTAAAPAGFQEGLDVSVSGATGGFGAAGSISNLAAGGSSNAITASLAAGTAGLNSGVLTVNLASNGTGTSGLATLSQGTGTVNLSATGYNVAQGAASPAPVNLGNFRVGVAGGAAPQSQNVAVSNTVGGSFTESLGIGSAALSGTAFSLTNNLGTGLVAAGGSNANALTVARTGGVAGVNNGTVAIQFTSDGTGTSGLGAINANSQNVAVQASGFVVAQGSVLPTTVNLGNFRAGTGAQTQTVNVSNTATGPTGYVEGLAASIGSTTGTATGTGFGNAAAGTSGALVVGLSGIAAGNNSGTVNVQLQSNGTTSTGSNGLGSLNLGASQAITVTGTGWRLAQADTVAPVAFGNVHVGDTVTRILTISNTGVADGFTERLNASFGAASDTRITTSGSVSGLAAGASNNTSMVVGVNTASAGSVNGSVVLNFASDGSGTSGLGLTSLAPQNLAVTADISTVNVFRLANAQIDTVQPVNLGNVRVGSTASQALSITNAVPNDGFSERLNASAGTSTAGVTASGGFNLLGAGATNSSGVLVGLDTSSAGAKAGTATIQFVSDGAGTSNLGQTALASQNVAVTGNVYRLASPVLNTPSVTVVGRVGDPVSTQAVSITNASPDLFTEGLKVTVAGSAGNAATNGAGITNLAAQGSDSSIRVGLANTTTAGTSNGSVTLSFVSTGAGTTGAADAALGTANVSVTGKLYTAAVGQLNTSSVDFGIVRVGQVVGSKGVNVTNAATTTALNDTLSATLGGLNGPFGGNATVGGIVAGAQGGMAVTLSTTTAGLYQQVGTVSFASHDGELADVSAGPDQQVTVTAQVNNLADARVRKVGGAGTLSANAGTYVLDLGTLTLGGSTSSLLDVLNFGSGFTDDLDLSFNLGAALGFDFTNWAAIDDLQVGHDSSDMALGFTATALGQYQGTIVLNGHSVNASDPNGVSLVRTLIVRANVVDDNHTVPLPGTLALVGAALAAGLASRRSRRSTCGRSQARAYDEGRRMNG